MAQTFLHVGVEKRISVIQAQQEVSYSSVLMVTFQCMKGDNTPPPSSVQFKNCHRLFVHQYVNIIHPYIMYSGTACSADKVIYQLSSLYKVQPIQHDLIKRETEVSAFLKLYV